jgi:hypothetical protein
MRKKKYLDNTATQKYVDTASYFVIVIELLCAAQPSIIIFRYDCISRFYFGTSLTVINHGHTA